jgi:hypothetical protein
MTRFGAAEIVVGPLPLAPGGALVDTAGFGELEAIAREPVAGAFGDAIDLGDPEAVFAGFGPVGAGALAARSCARSCKLLAIFGRFPPAACACISSRCAPS